MEIIQPPEQVEAKRDLDPETQEYLDGPWTASEGHRGRVEILGPDGDSILVCGCWNAAHFLTPRAVADYLMELHDKHRDALLWAKQREERYQEHQQRLADGTEEPLPVSGGMIDLLEHDRIRAIAWRRCAP